MKRLKSYEEHNEGIKSGIAKAGLIGSLLLNDPAKAQTIPNPYDASNPSNFTNIISPYSPLNPNGIFQTSQRANQEQSSDFFMNKSRVRDEEYNDPGKSLPVANTLKKMSQSELETRINLYNVEISNYSKSLKPKNVDDTLSNILSSIDSAAKSGGDSAKFNKLFNGLSKHMKDKYGYQIPNQNIEELSDQSVLDIKDGLSKKELFALMGWLGSICLAICGLPQAWSSYKDKHSHGVSWAFLALWALGEIFAMVYVYGRIDIPMMLNYGTNILILAVMIYYKVKPGNKDETD